MKLIVGDFVKLNSYNDEFVVTRVLKNKHVAVANFDMNGRVIHEYEVESKYFTKLYEYSEFSKGVSHNQIRAKFIENGFFSIDDDKIRFNYSEDSKKWGCKEIEKN